MSNGPPLKQSDPHEHQPSILGPYCGLCGMSMNRDYDGWADGTMMPPPERPPMVVTCTTCNGHGYVENPEWRTYVDSLKK